MKQFYASEEELKKDNAKMRKEIIKEHQSTAKSLFHQKIFYTIAIICLLLILIFLNNWGYLIGVHINPERPSFKNELRMYSVSINDKLLPISVHFHERRDAFPLILSYDTETNKYFYNQKTNILPVMDTYTLNIENYKCYSKKFNNNVTTCYASDSDSNLTVRKQKDAKYYNLQIKYENKVIYNDKYITNLTSYLKESGTYEITITSSYPNVKTTITSTFIVGAPKEGGEDFVDKINLKINDKIYKVSLVDNYTSRDLLNLLPLSLPMQELNGNEKFYYFDKNLVSYPSQVGEIKKGDIMLYGKDCLVIFYKDFTTHYSYTKIGHIDNPEDLEEVLGSGNVTINFEKP